MAIKKTKLGTGAVYQKVISAHDLGLAIIPDATMDGPQETPEWLNPENFPDFHGHRKLGLTEAMEEGDIFQSRKLPFDNSNPFDEDPDSDLLYFKESMGPIYKDIWAYRPTGRPRLPGNPIYSKELPLP